MANLLQSSQTQATSAPGYYNDYLSSLATKGQNAVNQAQYVGAQPLQQAAFEGVQSAGTAYQPTLNAAEQTLNAATSATSPLAAASPYLSSALTNPAQEAAGYMSPYVQSVINNMSDIGQRNIMQNLAPAATAAAVGSGQYGSKRGAEVLGQTEANALRDLNANIANTLNTGYNTALQTAVQQNQVANTAGLTAANAAGTGQSNLTEAGAQQGNLAATNQQLGLADINALSTLGQQQQTIGQNAQLFPLNNLSTLSGILRGYNIPTTTTTQLTGSPLSALSTLGAGTAGLFQQKVDSSGNPVANSSLFSQITGKSNLQDFLNSLKPTVPVGSVNGNPDGLANVDTSKWTNNGDGTFTTSTGQIVDQNGNPVI